MMRIAFLVMALPLAPAMAAQPAFPPKVADKCKPANVKAADGQIPSARARPLADMPPAVEIKALYREVNGCPKPIVVRRNVGNPGEAPSPDAKPDMRPGG